MVEIDAGVVSFCRQYLPNHNAGSYDDPRFKLVIDDGVNFVNQTSQTFDVIISDCTDPIGPGESLFTSAFYEGCKRCLNPAVFSLRRTASAFTAGRGHRQSSQLSHYFSDVGFYQAAIPTYYGGIMTFAWATDNDALRHLSTRNYSGRVFSLPGLKCRYYNGSPARQLCLTQYLVRCTGFTAVLRRDKKLKN